MLPWACALALRLLFRIDGRLVRGFLRGLHLRRIQALNLISPLRWAQIGGNAHLVRHTSDRVDHAAHLAAGGDISESNGGVRQSGDATDQSDGDVGQLAQHAGAFLLWRRVERVHVSERFRSRRPIERVNVASHYRTAPYFAS